jgi:hypothetical protein
MPPNSRQSRADGTTRPGVGRLRGALGRGRRIAREALLVAVVGLCGLFDAIISPEWASAVEREATMSVGASFVYAFAPLAILLHGLLLLRR